MSRKVRKDSTLILTGFVPFVVLNSARLTRSDTMTLRARKRLTAWLGIFAMCLIVSVPLISRLVMRAHADEPGAVLCSSVQPVVDGAHQMSGDPLAACGYCDLLADHVAVPAIPPVLPVLIVLIAIAAAPILSTRFTPLGAFPSGRPRAPPVFLQLSL
jgi:Protein of unknown function (DUF2946)